MLKVFTLHNIAWNWDNMHNKNANNKFSLLYCSTLGVFEISTRVLEAHIQNKGTRYYTYLLYYYICTDTFVIIIIFIIFIMQNPIIIHSFTILWWWCILEVVSVYLWRQCGNVGVGYAYVSIL